MFPERGTPASSLSEDNTVSGVSPLEITVESSSDPSSCAFTASEEQLEFGVPLDCWIAPLCDCRESTSQSNPRVFQMQTFNKLDVVAVDPCSESDAVIGISLGLSLVVKSGNDDEAHHGVPSPLTNLSAMCERFRRQSPECPPAFLSFKFRGPSNGFLSSRYALLLLFLDRTRPKHQAARS